MKRYFLILGFLVGLAEAATGAEHLVDQKKLQFDPGEITIKAGDAIVFKNSDRTAHQITAKSGMTANSPLLPPNKEFRLDFPSAGQVEIGCHIHPKMKLMVTVK